MTNANVESPEQSLAQPHIRPMASTHQDLQLFHDCFASNGSPRSMALLDWQYLRAPAGAPLVDFAESDDAPGRLAAIYAVFPVGIRVDGIRLLCAQSLNTLTDEQFRGRGLFVKMAKTLYARCSETGVALVYGFPNENSAHGFFKRLQWASLGRVPFMLCLLRSGYVLRKLGMSQGLANALDLPIRWKRSQSLPSTHHFRDDEPLNRNHLRIWESFARHIKAGVERDIEYLQWRLARPGETYRLLSLYVNDVLKGYAVWAVERSDSGPMVGKLMELLFDPEEMEAGEILALECVRRMDAAGAGAIWAWNFVHSPNHAALRKAGFFTLPVSRHPIELHMGGRALDDRVSFPRAPEDWYISLLDSDTH